jgi:hypothetical protein
VWPIALNQRNLIVCAQSRQHVDNVDSYMWPVLMAVKKNLDNTWPTVLILTGHINENERERIFQKLRIYIIQQQQFTRCDVAKKFGKADVLFLTPKTALSKIFFLISECLVIFFYLF